MHAYYVDVWRPIPRRHARLYDFTLILTASLFIALSARLTFPLPWSPVPITGQTFAVLILAFWLGPRRGVAAVLAYLAQGLSGLPVFAGGLGGPSVLLGPTGGYLLGFIPAAYLAGSLAHRGWDRHPLHTALGMLLANGVIYLFGLLWLAQFVNPSHVLAMGLIPFIPGDLLKIALAALLLPVGWKILSVRGRS